MTGTNNHSYQQQLTSVLLVLMSGFRSQWFEATHAKILAGAFLGFG